ncbi:MAG: NADH-quinone oxidoreductase subunit NuoK [Candidatus Hermodarchaeota archaeon]|nr:NADH-quinone oxidoreductase subunit NuoK [Candidatus Hermodarchaeota archaeon]
MQALDALQVPLSAFLAAAVVLYIIGIYGMATKRNMIKFLISLELLLDGAHLNFIAFAAIWTGMYIDLMAQAIVIVSISIGGGVIAIALGFIIRAYNKFGTLDVRKLNKLRH